MIAQGLQLQEICDFEAQNFLPPQNPIMRDTKLHSTMPAPTVRETAIFCRSCYVLFLSPLNNLLQV